RLTGTGDVWVAGTPSRWLPVSLTEDVLYVREDRVLAFDGTLSWETGTVPGPRHRRARAGRVADRDQGDRGSPDAAGGRAAGRLGGAPGSAWRAGGGRERRGGGAVPDRVPGRGRRVARF